MKKVIRILLAIFLGYLIGLGTARADECTDQCKPNKFVNQDAIVVCEQVCKLNNTNEAILAQLKRIAEANEKLLK